MTTTSGVQRPVWRTYSPKFLAAAAAHARAGGHAVITQRGGWWLLLPADAEGDMPELTAWALMDLRKTALEIMLEGDAEGLVRVEVSPSRRDQVKDWCERDAVHPTSTVAIDYDCRQCAMCCRENRVVLEDEDFARWHEAGRDDLASPALIRTVRGKKLLRLLKGGDCMQLRGNDCGIYEVRPFNCRVFPMGCEGCLSARVEAGLPL